MTSVNGKYGLILLSGSYLLLERNYWSCKFEKSKMLLLKRNKCTNYYIYKYICSHFCSKMEHLAVYNPQAFNWVLVMVPRVQTHISTQRVSGCKIRGSHLDGALSNYNTECLTRILSRITRRDTLVEQVLFIFQDHLNTPSICSG